MPFNFGEDTPRFLGVNNIKNYLKVCFTIYKDAMNMLFQQLLRLDNQNYNIKNESCIFLLYISNLIHQNLYDLIKIFHECSPIFYFLYSLMIIFYYQI